MVGVSWMHTRSAPRSGTARSRFGPRAVLWATGGSGSLYVRWHNVVTSAILAQQRTHSLTDRA